MAKKIQNPFNPIFSWYIKKRLHQIDLFIKYPFEVQEETLFKLLKYASNTEIGLKHNFSSIKSINDYKNRVPISHYEDIEPTIQKIKLAMKTCNPAHAAGNACGAVPPEQKI